MRTGLKYILALLASFCFTGCVDQINLSNGSDIETLLVVEGEITNEPGPYFVKLSTTSSIEGLGINSLGVGAQVVIESDSGEEELLREIQPGLYETVNMSFVGVIGRSYRLNIMLSNGDQYQSLYEVIPEPVEVNSLEVDFIDNRVEVNGIVQRIIGHTVSARLVKDSEVNKFIKFDMQGIFEAEVLFDDIGCGIPTPPFAICYAVRDALVSEVRISNDVGITSNEYSVDIATIPVQQKRRYLAIASIRSISERQFNFWVSLRNQLTREGSIFDPPLPPIEGNIDNIAGSDAAQGYFRASSITKSEICIDRSEVLTTITIPFACNGNCADIWAPASFESPDFGFCQ